MPDFDPMPNPYRSTQAFNSPSAELSTQYLEPPAIVIWQLVYCGVMVVVYLAVAAAGVFLFQFAEEIADQDLNAQESRVVGVAFVVLGMVLAGLFAAGFVWRKGMGGWVFHIVLISFGLTSVCCWPTNIPLLIFWIKHKDYIVNSGS